MQIIGMEQPWDNIRVGDIIYAYHAGMHVVTDIKDRSVPTPSEVERGINGSRAPLIYYTTVANSKGAKPKGKKTNCCDAAFCKKVDREALEKQCNEEVEQVRNKFASMIDILDSITI